MIGSSENWRWPPSGDITRTHLEHALDTHLHNLPDTHAAWHSRGTKVLELIDRVQQRCERTLESPTFGDARTVIRRVQRHLQEGYKAGWSNPHDPAYDRGQVEILRTKIDTLLKTTNVHCIAGLSIIFGDWELGAGYWKNPTVALNLLNPANTNNVQDDRVTNAVGMAQAKGKVVTTYAKWLRTGLTSIFAYPNLLPALPPKIAISTWSPDLLRTIHGVLVEMYPPLATEGAWPPNTTQSQVLWLRIAYKRLDGEMDRSAYAQAVGEFSDYGEAGGYPAMTKKQVRHMIREGMSPAEAIQWLRAQVDQ